MNCITGSRLRDIGIATLACLIPLAGPAADDALVYAVDYTIRPDPARRTLEVTLDIVQPRALLRRLSMQPDERISGIEADGVLEFTDAGLQWQPPATGGRIRWQVQVDHRRNGDGYDAWLGETWGLFRAEDVIPRAATRTLKGATSRTALRFELPADWSVVTQYYGRAGQFRVGNPARRFDQPSGWIIVGDIGVRRDRIAGTRVAVTGPAGEAVRRMDTLALLHWTLPELARLLPEPPPRLTVFHAGEPMWRGGLSAPQSVFVHADRPLISENATSTLLHEVMHLALGIRAAENFDWIVEGLAEYYSLELLARSGTISAARYKAAKAVQRRWGASAKRLCQPTSTGATSALAVARFTDLDAEIREQTGGKASLDNVVRAVWQMDDRISLATIDAAATKTMGRKPDTLHIDKLPGCRNIVDAAAASREN